MTKCKENITSHLTDNSSTSLMTSPPDDEAVSTMVTVVVATDSMMTYRSNVIESISDHSLNPCTQLSPSSSPSSSSSPLPSLISPPSSKLLSSLSTSTSSLKTNLKFAVSLVNSPTPSLTSSLSSQPSTLSSSSLSPSSSSTSTESAPPPSEGPPPTSFVTSSDDAIGQSNLIVNYLPAFMSQDDVRALFESMGQLESCKLVRDKNTGHSLGYGFVKFKSIEAAKNAMKAFNGLRIQNKTIKVSYARPSSEIIKGANLYISGLPPEINSHDLTELFGKYGSIISVRILSDSQTGLSKGVAFIRFDLRSEAEAAVTDLNGKVIFGAPITVKFASQPAISLDTRINQSCGNNHSRSFVHHPYMNSKHGSKSSTSHDNNDPSWTLHVNNLPASTSDSDVWSLFGPMGTVKSVKVIRDKVTGSCKGNALVSMPDLDQAKSAVDLLNGMKVVGGNLIQVQLKGVRSKHSETSTTTTNKQPARQQQQQIFLQQQQQLSFNHLPHFPFVIQQRNNDDNNANIAHQQQIHVQQIAPAHVALHHHPSAQTGLPGAILAHPTFYPTVIDSNLISGLNAIQSTDIFLSAPSNAIVDSSHVTTKMNIPPTRNNPSAFNHPSVVSGTFPITILHDL